MHFVRSQHWPGQVFVRMEVDNQVAAPAETRTPNCTEPKQNRSMRVRWKGGDSGDSAEKKSLFNEKQKNTLDSDRLLMEGDYTH